MKQQISSLMDADFDLDDASHVLNVMESSQHLRDTWAEYHLIGDVMRGEHMLSQQFSAKVMQQLATEPVVLAPSASKRRPLPNISKSTTAWALAASVAVVAAVGWFVVAEMQPAQLPMASNTPDDYLAAHQSAVPSNTAFLVEPVAVEK